MAANVHRGQRQGAHQRLRRLLGGVNTLVVRDCKVVAQTVHYTGEMTQGQR